MSIQRTAVAIYQALKDNTTAIAAMRSELATLAQNIATNAEYGREITSATVNGQSYGAQVSMTNADRLDLLSRVLKYIDAGVPPSSRSYAQF